MYSTMILVLVILFAAIFPPFTLGSFRWWRKLRGGHWELVNFDVLYSPFDGMIWQRHAKCSREVLPFEPTALVCCEEHGVVVFPESSEVAKWN